MGRALVLSGLLAATALSLAGPSGATEYPVYCQATVAAYGDPPSGKDFRFRALAVGGHAPYAVHWDFGDGQSGDAADVIHTYDQSGYYVISMSVSDSNDPASVCADTVTVFVEEIADPICVASASSTWGPAPLTIQFHGSPAFLDIDAYQWSFDDGETSTLQNPVHTFTTPGTYWVHLYGREPGYPNYHECVSVHRVTAFPAELLGAERPTLRPGLALRSAGPNPFVAGTRLSFDLPRAGHVRLRVIDASGRIVATLIDGETSAGTHDLAWNGRRGDTRPGAAGVYFAVLDFEGATETVRLVRMR